MRYIIPMFTYGTYRGLRSEYSIQHSSYVYMPLGTKIMVSSLNGLIYASPYGVFKILDLIDRIDIYQKNKELECENQPCYDECIGLCKNQHVL